MAKPVRLHEIVDALQMQFEEQPSFLDPETGEVHIIDSALLRLAEDGDEPDHMPKWQEPDWEIARLIVETGRFLRLPDKFEIHEWEIMREFTEGVKSDIIRDELERAIHGRGAFRMFKDTLYRHGIEKSWFAHRDEALRQIAIDWCEEHGLSWE